MNINHYIQASQQLGEFLLSDNEELTAIIHKTSIYNSWFTIDNIHKSLRNIAIEMLNADKLTTWLNNYLIDYTSIEPKKVGIVAAGNLPMVSFHDILCVIFSGHQLQIKLSEKDKILLPFIFEKWIAYLPELKDKIEIVERLHNFDAVIATGSNNSARYFDYYFSKYPNIIRKNRNSVAILDGTETEKQLVQLGYDIFDYFGLGCRNISKIFVPDNYDFALLLKALKQHNYVEQHTPYMNNLDYQRTIYLMSQTKMLDINFINIVENSGYSSPIACLYYEMYSDEKQVLDRLKQDNEQIQCVVSHSAIEFGQTQMPSLSDYADNIDTMLFLKNL